MLKLQFMSRFKRDLKLAKKRHMNITLLVEVVELLRKQQPLPEIYKDHPLHGDYVGYRECHILSDWLLIYKVDEGKLILTLFRTGAHKDLFDE